MRERLRAVAARAALALLWLAGCNEPPRAGGLTLTRDVSSAAPAPAPSARRPSRHYYLTNDRGRCAVYWTDGEQRSASVPALCPRSLLPGERLRLAGQSCLREGGGPERAVPVRCPGELVRAAQNDWEDAGPR
ncbi:MAG: hypothetical protein HY744_14910 [Deltaproteobacteria bacterium]|nr:hypothetical protein [Deltaproteobacteria bacterium]